MTMNGKIKQLIPSMMTCTYLFLISNMDRNIWINAKSTMGMEIQAEINLKKKVLPLEEQIPKEFHDFLDVFSEHIFQNQDPGTTKSN